MGPGGSGACHTVAKKPGTRNRALMSLCRQEVSDSNEKATEGVGRAKGEKGETTILEVNEDKQ